LSENVRWPESPGVASKVSAGRAAPAEIVNTLESLDEDVLYLCLGPLINLAEALRLNPEIKERISRLIYYGAHPDDPLPGWNTNRDSDSARFVFDSGLKIYFMGLPEDIFHGPSRGKTTSL
jgi:inosine-uridine nucleoside N-ribohydrolase